MMIVTRTDVGAECRHDMRPSVQLRASRALTVKPTEAVRQASLSWFLTSGDFDFYAFGMKIWHLFFFLPCRGTFTPTSFSAPFRFRVRSPQEQTTAPYILSVYRGQWTMPLGRSLNNNYAAVYLSRRHDARLMSLKTHRYDVLYKRVLI